MSTASVQPESLASPALRVTVYERFGVLRPSNTGRLLTMSEQTCVELAVLCVDGGDSVKVLVDNPYTVAWFCGPLTSASDPSADPASCQMPDAAIVHSAIRQALASSLSDSGEDAVIIEDLPCPLMLGRLVQADTDWVISFGGNPLRRGDCALDETEQRLIRQGLLQLQLQDALDDFEITPTRVTLGHVNPDSLSQIIRTVEMAIEAANDHNLVTLVYSHTHEP